MSSKRKFSESIPIKQEPGLELFENSFLDPVDIKQEVGLFSLPETSASSFGAENDLYQENNQLRCFYCNEVFHCISHGLPVCKYCKVKPEDRDKEFTANDVDQCRICKDFKIQEGYFTPLCQFCRKLYMDHCIVKQENVLVCKKKGICKIKPSSLAKFKKCLPCYAARFMFLGLTEIEVTRKTGNISTDFLAQTEPIAGIGQPPDEKLLKPFRCDKCGLHFSHIHILSKHISENHVNIKDFPFCCEECPERFATANAVLAHKQLFHTDKHVVDIKKFYYQCEFCNLKYEDFEKFDTHLEKAHNKGKRKLSEEPRIIKKSRPNSSPKLVDCLFCGKEGLTRQERIKHEQEVHWKVDSKIKCEDCGMQFPITGKDQLEEHKKAMHSNMSMSENYNCQDCGMTFSLEWTLKEHIWKNHHNNRRFCVTCCLAFESTSKLCAHIKATHSTAKPLKTPSVAGGTGTYFYSPLPSPI